MLTLPIVEHLDVFEDVLLGFVSGDIRSLVYQLTLERPEETFDARVVPAVAFATHTGDEAILRESPLVARGGILGGFKWSLQHLDGGGCDEHSKATCGSVWAAALAITRSTAGGRTR